jgi:hypothetical protein
MANEPDPDDSNVHRIERRPRRHVSRHVSRTRLVMGLLLIVALAAFIGLANRAVHENAEAIRQGLGSLH